MPRRYYLLIKPNEVYRGDEITMLSFSGLHKTGLIYCKDGRKERTSGHYISFMDVIQKGFYKEIPPEEAALIL